MGKGISHHIINGEYGYEGVLEIARRANLGDRIMVRPTDGVVIWGYIVEITRTRVVIDSRDSGTLRAFSWSYVDRIEKE